MKTHKIIQTTICMKANKLGKTSILLAATELVTSSTLHLLVRVIYMLFNTQLNSINSIFPFYQVSKLKHKSQLYNYIFSLLTAWLQSKPLLIRSYMFALVKPWYLGCNHRLHLYQNILIFFFNLMVVRACKGESILIPYPSNTLFNCFFFLSFFSFVCKLSFWSSLAFKIIDKSKFISYASSDNTKRVVIVLQDGFSSLK